MASRAKDLAFFPSADWQSGYLWFAPQLAQPLMINSLCRRQPVPIQEQLSLSGQRPQTLYRLHSIWQPLLEWSRSVRRCKHLDVRSTLPTIADQASSTDRIFVSNYILGRPTIQNDLFQCEAEMMTDEERAAVRAVFRDYVINADTAAKAFIEHRELPILQLRSGYVLHYDFKDPVAFLPWDTLHKARL
jgi:hypothetical protein